MKKTKVLVFPCGSQNGVDINFALRSSLRIELYGASSIEDHGSHIYKEYIGNLPNISEVDFIESLNQVIQRLNIEYIIPTHDTVALYLKENEQELAAKVVTSDLETVRICRYKSKTYLYFKDYDFTPTIFNDEKLIKSFPVFLKPDCGQGGKGSFIAKSRKEVSFYKGLGEDLIIMEFLPGEEVTVDCFTDKEGKLRYCVSRTRERLLAGISVNSKLIIEPSVEIKDIANTINNELPFRGYWYFQLKKDIKGDYKLLEISSRIAGTASANVGVDINLPLLSVMDYIGLDIEIQPNTNKVEVDRCLINRYLLDIKYDRIYVDLDDTLLIDGKVNSYLMMFLYQCVNEGKTIHLVSKHKAQINQTLANSKISIDLFDEVIHLQPEDQKYKVFTPDIPSIFIDNSFEERKQVRERLNFASFDVNSVEALLNWRG